MVVPFLSGGGSHRVDVAIAQRDIAEGGSVATTRGRLSHLSFFRGFRGVGKWSIKTGSGMSSTAN